MLRTFSCWRLVSSLCGVLLVLISTGVLILSSADAAIPVAASEQKIPVSALVKADGTLNLDPRVTASVDLVGYQVRLDPQRGPVVEPAISSGDWSSLLYGVNMGVQAMAVSGGNVFVGGRFTQICGNITCNSGNLTVNHIARWDGSHWFAMGNGVNADVYGYGYAVFAIAVSGSDVYIGGAFTQVCGNAACNSSNMTVNHIARWNGSYWSGLGNGVSSWVKAIAANGSDVYVGGEFKTVCGNLACDSGNSLVRYIAKWDGAAWSALKYGLGNAVYAIVVSGSNVYVGGNFKYACKTSSCTLVGGGLTPARHIALWNSSAWSSLSYGVDDTVYALATNGSDVYVGGSFTQTCGNATCDSLNMTVNRIAKWNGSTWSALRAGVNGSVGSIALSGNIVHLGGDFTQLCGNVACNSNTTANRIATWNGSAWSVPGYGVNDSVTALAITDRLTDFVVYVGGWFSSICGNTACNSGNSTVNYAANYSLTKTPTPTPTNTYTPTPTNTNTPTATHTNTWIPTPDSCTTPPINPTLKSPANNSTTSKTSPTLKWNAASCADTYKVKVKDAATGAKVAKKTGLTVLQYKLPTSLAHGKTYKWFVQACNSHGCTKSATWKFTVK